MTDTILVDGLGFAYPPPDDNEPAPRILKDLDLRVGEGEWLAVMGPSDVGKTTLCLLLAGLAPHLTGGDVRGQIIVAGQNTLDCPPPALASVVGVLFQEPDAQLFNPSVEAEIAWGLENMGLPLPQIQDRVDEMLALLHLAPLRHRAPGELSGGEKKRLALASVLAMRPGLLILDEPMGGLDPAGRREVLSALSELRHASSTSIVMIESDPEAVAAFADRLAILHQGQIVMEGTPREVFSRTERMEELGVSIPVMARMAAKLNQQLGTGFDFMTVDEAQSVLEGYCG